MAKIDRLMVGESLVGDGNEVAHIDLLIGPRGSAAETAFANALTNNKDGFTSLLAVVAPNLLTKPATVMFNKVTIKGAKQAVQMFGPAQRGVAMAVADCVEDGTIPAAEADNLFVSVGVFIHWLAEDDKKIQDYNYAATKESIKRAVAGYPSAAKWWPRRVLLPTRSQPTDLPSFEGRGAPRIHPVRRVVWPASSNVGRLSFFQQSPVGVMLIGAALASAWPLRSGLGTRSAGGCGTPQPGALFALISSRGPCPSLSSAEPVRCGRFGRLGRHAGCAQSTPPRPPHRRTCGV